MSALAIKKEKTELSDEQKRQFRQLFRIALNGHDHSCHDLCKHGSAQPFQHLKAALEGKNPEGDPVDPAIKAGIEMCREQGIPLTANNTAEENPVFFVSGRCFACYLYLVEQDLKPATKNLWGVTTLNQACQLLIETGDARILQHLLVNKHYPIDLPDDSEQTLVHQAAKKNSATAIHFLLDLGADINHRDVNYKTPLFEACHKSCFEAAQALIKRGAKHTGAHALNDQKENLLHAASRSSIASKKLIKMLIWQGIPLQSDGCCCKPLKKQFCKRISPHIKDYLYDKFVEYGQKKQTLKQKEPSSPKGIKRFLSRSNTVKSQSKLQNSSSSPDVTSSGAAKPHGPLKIICLEDTKETLEKKSKEAVSPPSSPSQSSFSN